MHEALGPDVELMNLGVAGDTSQDLIDEQLDRATDEIATRNSDADPDNDVAVVTLEIGGNDLLEIFFDLVLPGTCPNVEDGLDNPECVQQVRETLDTYGPNLDEILTRLREADPDVPIFLLTLYNPFSGGLPRSTILSNSRSRAGRTRRSRRACMTSCANRRTRTTRASSRSVLSSRASPANTSRQISSTRTTPAIG